MEFHGKVVRWRRKPVPHPYNPGKTTPGDWDTADRVELDGAWVSQTSSRSLRNEDRVQVLTAKSLYLEDPHADVQVGDGISEAAGGINPEYTVTAVPRADANPFTGWQPVREVPLEGAKG